MMTEKSAMSGQGKEIKSYELNRDEAPAYWEVDILWLLLADGKQTGGAFCQLEQLCPNGSGPPPHTHTQIENFYIMDGAITFLVDGKELIGEAPSSPFSPAQYTVSALTVKQLSSLTRTCPTGFELVITNAPTEGEGHEALTRRNGSCRRKKRYEMGRHA